MLPDARKIVAMNPIRNKETEEELEVLVSQKLTADALLRSPLVGMWSDRTGISDSSEFARDIRNNVHSGTMKFLDTDVMVDILRGYKPVRSASIGVNQW